MVTVVASLRVSALGLALAAIVVVGCGARSKPATAPTEPPDYDWSGFNDGKEAPRASAKAEKADNRDKVAEKTPEKTTKPEKQEAKVDKDDAPKSAAVSTTEPAKKLSATKIGGQSVSEITPDAIATATQRATKKNLVSTNVIVGAEYEQVSVVLDNLAVQIVRPAAAPDKSGPKVRSPKARKGGVAHTEAAYYDASADVLVIVQADKKTTSSKALAALVSGAAPAAKKNIRVAKPKRAS